MLQRKLRLRRRSDFGKVHRFGRIVHTSCFSIKYRPNRLPDSRTAVVISTKVSKKAPVRNRTRRRFYACLRELWPRITPGYDFIVLTRHQATELRGEELRSQLESALRKAGLIQ